MTVRTFMRLCANTLILPAILVALILATRVEAGTDSSPADDMSALRAKIGEMEKSQEAMRNELEQMRAKEGDNWLNERRTEEVKALVKEVLTDADTRASLMGDGMTAGYDGKFFVAAPNGDFRMNFTGQAQVRYIANFRHDDGKIAGAGNSPQEDGFQLRRVKVTFDGFVGNPKIEYKIQMATDRDTSVIQVEDAWIAGELTPGLKLFGGRFQDRFSREAYMSSKNQQTVDRSAVANIFAGNDDYVEGAGLEWKPAEALRLTMTINDGLNSGTPGPNVSPAPTAGFTNGGQDFANTSSDFAASGRVDVKLAGDWSDEADVEAWTNTSNDFRAFVGAGVHWEQGKSGDKHTTKATAAVGTYDSFVQWTVDGLMKYQGFSLMGAGYGWHFQEPPAAVGGKGSLNYYAATVQAGYLFWDDKLEPFARWEWIDVDGRTGPGATNINLVTAGVNYFFRKHSAKATVDVVWSPDNLNAVNTLGTSLTGIGLLTDPTNLKNQFVIRAQFQLLF